MKIKEGYVWVIPGQEGLCNVSGSPVLISSQAANCAHRAGCSGICGFIALREVYWNLFLVISLFHMSLGLFHVSQYYHNNHFGAGFLSCFNDSSDLLTFSIHPNKAGLCFSDTSSLFFRCHLSLSFLQLWLL